MLLWLKEDNLWLKKEDNLWLKKEDNLWLKENNLWLKTQGPSREEPLIFNLREP